MDRKPLNRIILKRKIGIVLVLPKQTGSIVDNACDLRRCGTAPFRNPGLDTLAGFGGAMKVRQPREAMPLTVWIAFVLMAIGTVVYLTGFLIIEDVLAFVSAKK
jgi:hypothetical protein